MSVVRSRGVAQGAMLIAVLIATGCSESGGGGGGDGGQSETCAASEYRTESGCLPTTACSADQWESTAPTATSDRGCTALTVCSGSDWQSTPPTATSDRGCTVLAVCSEVEWQTAAPTATSDRACAALTVCTTGEWQSAAPTATSDRGCTALTVCEPGTTESVAPTATSDRVCSSCGLGRYESGGTCHDLTVCESDEWQSTAPTGTSDRACTALTVCEADEWQSTAPTATSDRACTALTVCESDEWESAAPTAMSDRVCLPHTPCAAGTRFVSAATPTSNTVCDDCAPGSYCAGGLAAEVTCGYRDFDGDPATPCETLEQVALAGSVGCLRGSSGRILCWPDSNPLSTWTDGENLGVTDVAVRASRVCTSRTDGSVRCWDADGDLPPPSGLPTVASLEIASWGELCVLTAAGVMSCPESPRVVPSDLGVVREMASASSHTCARLVDGTVRCWGDSTAAEVPADLVGVTSLAAGDESTCVVLVGGTVRCWGASSLVAATPSDLVDAVEVDVGTFHACASRTGGEIRCWGDDSFGETSLPPGAYVSFATGMYDTCAITADGELVCVGFLRTILGAPTPTIREPTPCATAAETQTMILDCGTGHVITAVDFASYGTPTGTCATTLATSSCHAPESVEVVEDACLGRSRCAVPVSNTVFVDPCDGIQKSLVARVSCD